MFLSYETGMKKKYPNTLHLINMYIVIFIPLDLMLVSKFSPNMIAMIKSQWIPAFAYSNLNLLSATSLLLHIK